MRNDNNPGMARPIVVIAFLTVGFGKFILFVKKSATNPTESVNATFRIFGIDDISQQYQQQYQQCHQGTNPMLQ